MPLTSTDRPLRLGTRSSPLAMAQANETKARLCAAAGLGDHDIEIVAIRASGDKITDRPLADIGGKALWTKELDGSLHAGEIDFAVHSAKDVETIRPDFLCIAAVLPREDVRDVIIGAASIAALPRGATVGTSAPRRAALLLNARPDCKVVSIRGNVATRMALVAAGEVDATFLALAGLNRLGQSSTGHPLDPQEWPPAPGQAAIAIECRADDTRTRALLAQIDDAPSHAALLAERALLAGLGGSCHSPVAVHTRRDGDIMHMRAVIFSPNGAEKIEASAQFAPGDAAAPLRLASTLLATAPPAIADFFAGPQARLS